MVQEPQSLYASAVAYLRSYSAWRLAELDAERLAALHRNQGALRARARGEGLDKDPEDKSQVIRDLLAHTIAIVPRDSDGYPELHIPPSTYAVILAGVACGILPITSKSTGAGVNYRYFHVGSLKFRLDRLPYQQRDGQLPSPALCVDDELRGESLAAWTKWRDYLRDQVCIDAL
jgi:hypothetical protein